MVKIAIIEDDQTISQMYRMKFEAAGFAVEVAGDGKAGIMLVQRTHPDIILLDLQMPHLNGADTLEHIRAYSWGKAIPVIVLTNLGHEEAPKKLQHLGVHSYIVKAELTPSQVVKRVEEALTERGIAVTNIYE